MIFDPNGPPAQKRWSDRFFFSTMPDPHKIANLYFFPPILVQRNDLKYLNEKNSTYRKDASYIIKKYNELRNCSH